MPRTKRIRDARRRSKWRLVYQKDGLLRGTTTQPAETNNVKRVPREDKP